MDEESEQIREVYAQYGLAMYWAQCLEQSMFQHLLFFDHFPKAIRQYQGQGKWEEDFDSYESKELSQTMGRLIRRVREAGQPTEEIEAKMNCVLKHRNWLAHGYFSDRAVQLTRTDGRAVMITELEDIREEFRFCSRLIDDLTEPVMLKHGLNIDMLKEIEESLVKEYEGRNSA